QRSRLARQDRYVMPGIVDCLAAPETAPMFGDDLAILADHDPVGVGMDLDWATQRLCYDRVLVVVETDETGLRDGSRNSVEPVEPPSITNETWPLGLEDRPDCLVSAFGMRMRLGIGNALIDQPTIHLLVSPEPQPRREEALAHQPHLVLHLPLLPARSRGAGGRLDQVMAAHPQKSAVECPVPAHANAFDPPPHCFVDCPPPSAALKSAS